MLQVGILGSDYKSQSHFSANPKHQLQQFTIMFGNTPHIFNKIPDRIFDYANGRDIKKVIKALQEIKSRLDKVEELAPSSGGRGKKIIRRNGESISQVGAPLKDEQNIIQAIDIISSTMVKFSGINLNV